MGTQMTSRLRSPSIFSLKGQNILLTGASGHLGQAIAQGLCAAGAHVLLNGRNIERLNTLLTFLLSEGYSAEILAFNILDKQQTKHAFNQLNNKALHSLINNAYNGDSGTIETSKPHQYRHSYEISIVASQTLVTACLPNLRHAVTQNGSASVINIASMYGLVSPDIRLYDSPSVANPPFYGAAKAALIQWTRYAACEFGHENIRFNSISPGPFPTESIKKASPQFLKKLTTRVPIGRVGTPTEIQGPVVFLTSTASSYVNGCNLKVDGGWTAW